MSKKRTYSHVDCVAQERPLKRARSLGRNRFDDLGDELVLRILSFLPLQVLTRTDRVCRRFQRLATDNEIWRAKFYNHFVRPRARRIPGLAGSTQERLALHYASRSAKWLEHYTEPGVTVDWKRRFKVRLNWSNGRCRAHEVSLDTPSRPRLLVKIIRGLILTASQQGLRVYSQRQRPQLLTSRDWAQTADVLPTAITADVRDKQDLVLAVAFSNGSFSVFRVHASGHLDHELHQECQTALAINSIAVSWPFVLTMADHHGITLYEVVNTTTPRKCSTKVLATLYSEAVTSPVSLSLRKTSNNLVASVAYSFDRLGAGWCLGIQELRLDLSGQLVASRTTSSVEAPLVDHPLRIKEVLSRSATTAPLPLHPQLMRPPTSISHAGCYILVGLADNTLMVYTLVSNVDTLQISAGRRLWGHTSSVSGAEVSDRGKALTVSSKGDEVRVWELEDILSSYTLNKTSTKLKPFADAHLTQAAVARRSNGVGIALSEMKHELPWIRHSIGFDDEQVVVLSERDRQQVLSCYDFA